jgi:hypothetical protein
VLASVIAGLAGDVMSSLADVWTHPCFEEIVAWRQRLLLFYQHLLSTAQALDGVGCMCTVMTNWKFGEIVFLSLFLFTFSVFFFLLSFLFSFLLPPPLLCQNIGKAFGVY